MSTSCDNFKKRFMFFLRLVSVYFKYFQQLELVKLSSSSQEKKNVLLAFTGESSHASDLGHGHTWVNLQDFLRVQFQLREHRPTTKTERAHSLWWAMVISLYLQCVIVYVGPLLGSRPTCWELLSLTEFRKHTGYCSSRKSWLSIFSVRCVFLWQIEGFSVIFNFVLMFLNWSWI